MVPEEPPATRRVHELRISERLPSSCLKVNKVGSSPPNKRPPTSNGSVEGMVGFRLTSDLLKIPQEPAGGTKR